MKITLIGTGYVGLVSGAVFADWGHDVVCLDVDQNKIDMILRGEMPIYEDGLDELVAKVIKSGNFRVTTDYKMAVEHGELLFICVGTPSMDSGEADLKYVFSAAKSIGENMPEDQYKVVVTKSTVPVHTNRQVQKFVQEGSAGRNINFDVASNPEFLREGTSIWDMNNPDRIVIGSESKQALAKLEELTSHLGVPIVKTDLASAELIKYAANAFLATKISFINEISQICERTGADVKSIAEGMGLDKRIGPKFLNASIGYGGSCFPKDVSALYRTSSQNFYDFRMLRGVIDANDQQKNFFLEKIWKRYGNNLSGIKLGILGTAFKDGTDDVRKSPAIDVIRILRGAGCTMMIYDPEGLENSKALLGNKYIEYANSYKDVFDQTDAVVILTEWKEFITYDYPTLVSNMKEKVIFDGRNLLDPEEMIEAGIDYYAIGRAKAK